MKKSQRQLVAELQVGDSIEFPIRSLEVTRNYISSLNSKHYLEGKKWTSQSDRERGIVTAYRIS